MQRIMSAESTYEELRFQAEKLEHITQVLRAVRNVNQLITKETNQDRLLKRVCELLVETRGYNNAWIALIENGKAIEPFYRSGFNGSFAPMVKALSAGNYPGCARWVMRCPGLVVIDDPAQQCPDCVFSGSYSDTAGMAMRLESHGRIFGWLCASIPKTFVQTEEEQRLFEEVAEDIAFALWSLEADAQRDALLEKYEAILSTTTNAVISLDPEGTITLFNPGAEKMFGYSAEEAIGKHVSIFAPPNLATEQVEKIRNVYEIGAVEAYETVRMDSNGKRIDVEVTLDIRKDEKGRPIGLTAIIRDITERKRFESEQKWSSLRNQLLADTASRLLQSEDPQLIIEDLCHRVMVFLDCQTFFNFLVEKEQKQMHLNAFAGIPDNEAAKIEWLDYGVAVCGCVAQSKERMICENISTCESNILDLIKSYGIQAYCCHPLMVENQLLGTLSFGTRTKSEFDSREIEVMEAVTRLVALAMKRIQTEKALQETSAVLTTAMDCSTAGIAIADAPDGKLRYVNDAGLAIRKGTREKIVNEVGINEYVESWQILHFDGTPYKSDEVPLARAVLYGEKSDKQFIIRRPGEEDRVVWANAAPVLNDNGEVIAGIVVFPDITDLRLTQEALQESERKFKNIFDSISDPIFIHDLEKCFLEVNKAACEKLGYTCDEMLQMRPGDFIVEDPLAPGFAEMVQKVRHQGRQVFRSKHRRKDGNLVPVEVHSRIIRFEGQQCIISVARDISDRITSERKIKESEAKFSAFMKYLPGFAYIKDFNRRHLFVNESLANFFGMENGEWLGKTLEQILPVSQALDIKKTDERLLKNRETLIVEEALMVGETTQTYLSAKFPIDGPDGEVLLGGVSVDITVMKQAEAARKAIQKELVERNKFIETILENLPIGLAVNYINEGRAVYINQKFEEIYGWPKSELEDIEQFFQKVYPDPSYRNRIKNRLMKDIQSGDPKRMVWDGFEVTTHDGEKRTISVKNIPLFEQNLMISTVQDITESCRLQERLQQAQKMEAIGNLAGGIAHDFNNILFPIIGLSELLLEDLPPESSEYDNIKEILQAGKRAGDLVNQILSFSRQTEQKTMPIRIQHILKEVVKLCRSTIPSYIDIEQAIQRDCAKVMANPTHIHQICMNLMTNAYHALEGPNGKILLELKEIVLEDDDTADTFVEPGRYAVLMISDTGSGIPPGIIEKIFEPYFTTKEQGKGTGLGLAVVYGIVKKYHGDIKVYSESGKGTTFKVYLPVIEKAEDGVCVPSTEELQTGKERILLVDDEESIAKLESQILERLGYNVTYRTSSVEALEAFKANP